MPTHVVDSSWGSWDNAKGKGEWPNEKQSTLNICNSFNTTIKTLCRWPQQLPPYSNWAGRCLTKQIVVNETSFFLLKHFREKFYEVKAHMRNTPAESQLGFCSKLAKIMIVNVLLNDGRVEDMPSYPITRTSFIILDEYEKRKGPSTLKIG